MNLPKTLFSILVLVTLDQISKFWISSNLLIGESINLLPFLNLTLVHNSGIAFSLFNYGGELYRWLLTAVILLVLAYLILLLIRSTKLHRLENLSLIFIVCGGIANLIDRIFFGYVIDFIHLYYHQYSFYVFNLADSYITIGIIIYLYYFLSFEENRKE